jgi:ABC-2 type transport system permease protein
LRIGEFQAIYIMWLREIKRFIRSRSRVVATIVQPLFFLLVLGAGLRSIELPGMESENYTQFIAPGIIAMSIMFSSMFTGISVLWDKQFGFLQEVLVAPISRLSIIVGRTLGGATTALLQGLIILFVAFALGIFPASILGLFLTLVFMVLVAFTAVGFGLVIASKMQDMQGFPLIMNLVVMPLILISSAFFKLDNLPSWVLPVAQFNPIFYMVDGLRGSLIGADNMFHPFLDLLVVLAICVFMMGIGSYLFSKCEA